MKNYGEIFKLKNRINHDWLSNEYLLFLSSVLMCIDTKTDKITLEQSVLSQLFQWHDQHAEITSLLLSIQHYISPVSHCTEKNFSALSSNEIALVKELFEAWFQSSPANQQLNKAKTIFKEIDQLVSKQSENKITLEPLFWQIMRDKCQQLSIAFSAISIEVTLPE